MLKNATIYRLQLPAGISAAAVGEAMEARPFTPCGATQSISAGWVPPRGEGHGALVEAIGGHWIARLLVETKTVPADVLKRAVAERCKTIEAETGRKPGKKERKEITEDTRLELLPHAFPKRLDLTAWIDPVASTLVADTASEDWANILVTELCEVIQGLRIAMVVTEQSPGSMMAARLTHWDITEDERCGFEVGRACELKATDESGAVVRYKNHNLEIPEVLEHIQHGKAVQKLALEYSGRVAFTLSASLVLSGIEFLDGVYEGGDKAVDGFDADVAIMTGELQALLKDLIRALGGEVVLPQEGAPI